MGVFGTGKETGFRVDIEFLKEELEELAETVAIQRGKISVLQLEFKRAICQFVSDELGCKRCDILIVFSGFDTTVSIVQGKFRCCDVYNGRVEYIYDPESVAEMRAKFDQFKKYSKKAK